MKIFHIKDRSYQLHYRYIQLNVSHLQYSIHYIELYSLNSMDNDIYELMIENVRYIHIVLLKRNRFQSIANKYPIQKINENME